MLITDAQLQWTQLLGDAACVGSGRSSTIDPASVPAGPAT
jgi:hypothetical protein